MRWPTAVEPAIRSGLADAGHLVHLARAPRLHAVPQSSRELSSQDLVVVQYECDATRTRAGEQLLDVLGSLTVPAVLVLHSIPSHPARRVEELVVELCDLAALVVVMSVAAKSVLTRTYAVDEAKVIVVPWGSSIARVVGPTNVDAEGVGILSWGDLAPAMGVEHLIDAVAVLHGLGHQVRCTIASDEAATRTTYAAELMHRAREAGVGHAVRIVPMGSNVETLIAVASLVVLPYDSEDALVTPALIDAIAAGRPVIATDYPHAADVLQDGGGLIVPPRNAVALAEAIRIVTTDRAIIDAMTRRARLLAPSLSWRVAGRGFALGCAALSRGTQQMAA